MVEANLLDALEVLTFTGNQVQEALGVSAATLTRHYTTYGVGMFSKDSSQGKSREYVLGDVMQLGLAVELARTTSRPKLVAAVLNQVAGFEGARKSRHSDENDENAESVVFNNEANANLRAAARKSVKALPPLYWAEDRPIFIHIWPGFAGHDVIDDPDAVLRDGLFINATKHLSLIRIALAQTLSD